MYAVIKTGGKQYRVREGDTLRVEKLAAEAGAKVQFDQVLMVGEGDKVKIGAPYLTGSQVSATVKSQGRDTACSVARSLLQFAFHSRGAKPGDFALETPKCMR